MEPTPKKFKADPMLERALKAGLQGDFPLPELLEWEKDIDTPEAVKYQLQRALVDCYGEMAHHRFLSDELTIQDACSTNSEFYAKFDSSAESGGSNTKNPVWPIVLEDHIEEMDDCTFETIQAELGFMFGLKTSESRSSIRKRGDDVKAYLQPKVESEVQHVAQSYLLPIIKSCVAASRESLPESLGISRDPPLVVKGIEGLMKPDAEEKTLEINNVCYQKAKRKGIPDWSIYLLLKGEKKRYVTIGETKLDSKWISSWLPKKLGGEFDDNEAEWPIRQQAKYCFDGDTSWSFLYTPKEVVLCRFYIVPSSRGRAAKPEAPKFGLKWKSIPLVETASPRRIGPVMAIWSWIIFAFLDQSRGIGTLDKLSRLTDIVPKQPDSGLQELLDEALKAAEEGLKAVEESGVIKVAAALATNPAKRSRQTMENPPSRSTVWEGRLRPRKVVIGVGLA